MIWGLKIGFVFFFSFWFTLPSVLLFYVDNQIVKEHNVLIKHPGEEKPIEVTLVEISNKEGLPVEYYMDVQSVICLQGVCKVILVRLYWDNIGNFKKYLLEEGKTLEKYKADLFDSSDYSKLHTILANPDSPFKDVRLNEVLTVVNELDTHEVDAISGATALELDEKDTVTGASLTCYTLWHWANGEIISIIKNITGNSASSDNLFNFLINENKIYFFVALEVLNKRKIYTNKFVETIIQQSFKDENLLKTSIQYFETAPSEIYFSSLKKLFMNGNENFKTTVTRSLINTKHALNEAYLIPFSVEISRSKSYKEVSLFLDLLQETNVENSQVTENIINLLESDFLIARRTYYFLMNKNISSEQLTKVKRFSEKYKDKL